VYFLRVQRLRLFNQAVIFSYLNGQCHEMDICVKSINNLFSTSVYALMVSKLFKSFSRPYTIINFIFASLKLLINFENAYRNPLHNFLLCDWPMFYSVDASLAAEKMHKN
jgi:hypothetical protein